MHQNPHVKAETHKMRRELNEKKHTKSAGTTDVPYV